MIAQLALAASLALGGGVDTVHALATHRPTPGGPSLLERAAMRTRAESTLEQLRGGAPVLPAAQPDQDERAALDEAQSRAQELETLRAGDLELNDREIAIIAITAAAVLLLVILF